MELGQNLIDGKLIDRAPYIDVVDPGNLENFGRAASATPADVEAAVEAAVKAQPDWAADLPQRRKTMIVAAAAIDADAAELARLLSREQGKPLAEATREVSRAAVWLRHYAEMDLASTTILDDKTRRIEVRRRPIGPVLAIVPWNFPVSLLAWKLAPALLTGNALVVKPSPYTPLTTQRIGALLAPILPAGVLNILAGDHLTGQQLVTHPKIGKIAFTGSTAIGREIMAMAAGTLKRVTLELGGNDPAIVLDDADPNAIAERLFWSAFANCGQVCIAVKRLFVPQAMAKTITDNLAEIAKSVQVGHGLEAGVRIGPLNNKRQMEHVAGLVESAKAAGATIAAGGRRLEAAGNNRGHYYAPTIVSDIDAAHPLVAEEQFGPALPVIPYRNLDEAMTLADSGPYGLGASIWTKDPERGAALAGRLNTGTVWINHHMEARPDAPFGGAKSSGIGYENGAQVLEAYSQLQVVNQARG